MQYMAAHGLRRARPAELVPGTVRVISVAMPYLPPDTGADWRTLERARAQQPGEAVISVYARGRDYHKVVRARLQRLADRLAAEIGPFGHRVFCDSAPVLEVELAGRAGLHTVVAPPVAQITPGWSVRSMVHQLSNEVRPALLT